MIEFLCIPLTEMQPVSKEQLLMGLFSGKIEHNTFSSSADGSNEYKYEMEKTAETDNQGARQNNKQKGELYDFRGNP